MRGTVLSLCDRTGNMVLPWLDAGYDAVTVDLQPEINPHPNRKHIVADVRGRVSLPISVDAVFAFPPCTHLAVSGARWFKAKGLPALIEGLQIVEACRSICEAYEAPWMIENPVGRLSTLWREPDYYFHPWQYTAYEPSDHYTKKTCLWTGGGFVMPRPAVVRELVWVKPDDRIYKAPPSGGRGDIRSVTPMGFARAVFEANAPHLSLRSHDPAPESEYKLGSFNR